MKKPIYLTTLTLVSGLLLISPAMAAPPDAPPPEANRKLQCREGKGPHCMNPRLGKIMSVIDLSDKQKQEITVIAEKEKKAAQPLFQKLHDAHQKIADASRKEFDEAEIRKLAAQKSEAETELLVLRLKTRNSIDAVLTPDQRQIARLAEALLDQGDKKGPPGRPGHHGPRSPQGFMKPPIL